MIYILINVQISKYKEELTKLDPNSDKYKKIYNKGIEECKKQDIKIAVFIHDDVYINCDDFESRIRKYANKFTLTGLAGTKSITIKEPVQVVQVPPRSQNDPGSIAFSPFLEYAKEFKDGFKIKKDDILITSTPVVELENQYNQIFGSGITIASSIPKVW